MPQPVKATLAVMAVIAAIIFGYYYYTQKSPTYQVERLKAIQAETTAGLAQIANAAMPDREDREGPPAPEDRTRMRDEMYTAMGVTPEQKTKLAELEKQFQDNRTSGSWQARHDAMDKVLTPDQQQKQRDYFQNQRNNFMQRMQARNTQRMNSLSPADQAAYQKKLEERRGQWGGRGGRGGGPGGPRGGNPPNGGIPGVPGVPGGGIPPVPGGGNPPK